MRCWKACLHSKKSSIFFDMTILWWSCDEALHSSDAWISRWKDYGNISSVPAQTRATEYIVRCRTTLDWEACRLQGIALGIHKDYMMRFFLFIGGNKCSAFRLECKDSTQKVTAMTYLWSELKRCEAPRTVDGQKSYLLLSPQLSS